MKLKKFAGIILSCCLAAATLGTVTANAVTQKIYCKDYGVSPKLAPGGVLGFISYGYEKKVENNAVFRRWYSKSSSYLYIRESYLIAHDGGRVYASGSAQNTATRWLPTQWVKGGRTTFYAKRPDGRILVGAINRGM